MFELDKSNIDVQRIQDVLAYHQHTGSDGSSRMALLDWKELKRTELAVAATSITLDLIPAKRFLKIFIQHDAKSGSSNNFLRFNNDSGANYTFLDEGGVARTSRTEIDLIDALSNALGYYYVIDIVNVFGLVKTMKCESLARITSAATAQSFLEIRGTWVNTTAFITRVDLVSSGAPTFPAGSQIIVYGSNF